jgi:hypothetical protein
LDRTKQCEPLFRVDNGLFLVMVREDRMQAQRHQGHGGHGAAVRVRAADGQGSLKVGPRPADRAQHVERLCPPHGILFVGSIKRFPGISGRGLLPATMARNHAPHKERASAQLSMVRSGLVEETIQPQQRFGLIAEEDCDQPQAMGEGKPGFRCRRNP